MGINNLLSDIGLPGLGCKPVLTDSKPRVVIVGAGFGGLAAAERLPRQDATSPSSTATRTPHSSRCCIRWQPAVSTLAMSPTDFAPSPLTTVLTPTSVALV